MLRLEWHGEQMLYRQFRERLLHIAKEEQHHAQWLARRITGLGGEVPQVSFIPEEGLNSWECLRMDLEAEKRCCESLMETLARDGTLDPETAQVLSRALEEDELHQREIRDMLMRSDPQAEPYPQRGIEA